MRIEKLDALRGIAALVVVVQHAMERVIQHSAFTGPLQAVAELLFRTGMNFGRFGVVTFFLISGFVIPFSFRGTRPLAGFAISRFFRLYPAYWASLAFALVVIAATARPMPGGVVIAANVTMFQTFVGQPDVVHVYWTLAMELMFYLLCAGLFRLGLLGRSDVTASAALMGLVGAMLAAGVTFWFGRKLPANIPLNLGLMFLGTLMRQAWLEGDASARTWLRIVLPLVLVAIPVTQWLVNTGSTLPFVQPLPFTTSYLVAIGFFVATIHRPWTVGGAWLWLGAISYAVYLVHGPWLQLATTVFGPLGPISALGFLAAVIAATLASAALVYRFVEQPFIAMGHRQRARISPRQSTVQLA